MFNNKTSSKIKDNLLLIALSLLFLFMTYSTLIWSYRDFERLYYFTIFGLCFIGTICLQIFFIIAPKQREKFFSKVTNDIQLDTFPLYGKTGGKIISPKSPMKPTTTQVAYDVLMIGKQDYNGALLLPFKEINSCTLHFLDCKLTMDKKALNIKLTNTIYYEYEFQGINSQINYSIPLEAIKSVEQMNESLFLRPKKIIVLNMKNGYKNIFVFKPKHYYFCDELFKYLNNKIN